MNFLRSVEQQEVGKTARALLQERCPIGGAGGRVGDRSAGEAIWRQVGELGWPGIAVRAEHGGLGLGWVELCILLEEVGAVCAPLPLLGSALAAAAIDEAGSDAERERWLPMLASGSVAGAFGVTSAAGGATLLPDALEADVVVLVEQGSARIALLPGERACAAETIDPTRSYGTVPGAVAWSERRAPLAIERAKATTSGELVGLARGALELTLAYVKSRRQFGVPVGSFQGVSHRAAEMALEVESSRAATEAAALSADGALERLPIAAAVAKAAASKAAKAVTSAAIQLHGGIGFTWEASVHWYYKRSLLLAAYLGDAAFQHRRLATLLAEGAR